MLQSLVIPEGFWYLASPYSKYEAGIEQAYKDASFAAGKLLSAGVRTYCPIAHTHPIAEFGGLDHYDYDTMLSLDQQFMNHSYGILVLRMPGYAVSHGVNYERDYFKRVGRPEIHLSWPELKIVTD